MSEDGRSTVVIIALLGNPFSPAYARARSRGSPRALDHCAMHVALEGPSGRYWSLRERTLHDAARGSDELRLGTSRIAWSDQGITVDVDETTTPGGRRLLGRVILRPECASQAAASLDARGDHRWWPVAPLAHAEVDFREPRIRFAGHGYADANAGNTPIDSAFASWSWSRARVDASQAVVAYDVMDKRGHEHTGTMIFRPSGCKTSDRIARCPLPPSRWGLARSVNADKDTSAALVRDLEDGPCYARALVRTRLLGREVTAMHEVLSADRLGRAWVQFLLGFKIGRVR